MLTSSTRHVRVIVGSSFHDICRSAGLRHQKLHGWLSITSPLSQLLFSTEEFVGPRTERTKRMLAVSDRQYGGFRQPLAARRVSSFLKK